MDQKLYADLAVATKFYFVELDFKERIKNENKNITNLRKYAKEKNNSTDYAAPGGFVVLVCIVALLFLIAAIIAGEKHAAIIALIAFFIALAVSIVLFSIANRIDKKHKNEYETIILPKINMSLHNIESLEKDLETFKTEHGYVLDFLPETYRNAPAVSFMFLVISNGRADTLKEAMNLYEEQLHRWKLEAYAHQSAETQEYCSRAMEELNSKQAQTNEHLRAIEFMQYVNYTNN